jgi:hypothetical protein
MDIEIIQAHTHEERVFIPIVLIVLLFYLHVRAPNHFQDLLCTNTDARETAVQYTTAA